MNTNQKNTAALVAATLLLGSTFVSAANITISDNNAGSSGVIENDGSTDGGWYKGGAAFAATGLFDPLIGAKSEYQEVEPHMQMGAVWDLAAFVTPSAGRLGVVSGYNLAAGYSSTSIGDIMVKVGPGPNYYGDQNQTYYRYTQNTFGYQFAVKMNFGASTYSVFALDANTVMENGEYAIGRNGGLYNSASQPWRLSDTTNGISGANTGFAVAGFQDLALTYDADRTGTAAKQSTLNTLVGFSVTSEYKYYAEIGTTFVNAFALANNLNNPDVLYKLTMECGNDNMLGKETISQNVGQVPDGSATLVLMGIGLLSIGCLIRIRRQAAA